MLGYRNILLRLSLAALAIQGVSFAEELEVRHITPPRLDAAYLGKRVLCHRPFRKGSPRLEAEQIEGRLVVHNYGHGGSGWTLAPGSAKVALDLLEKTGGKLDVDTPITVVGAGAIGLFTALELVDRGYRHLTIIAESFEDLPSHYAGGLWAPAAIDDDFNMPNVIEQIGVESYKVYQRISRGEHPAVRRGVRVLPTYFSGRKNSSLERFVGKILKPGKDVILDFGTGVRRQMVAYDDGIFMDTGRLMSEMRRYLEVVSLQEKGPRITFVQKKLSSLKDVEDKVIFNCSGMGAQGLNQDQRMVSIQGHLILLKNQNAEDLSHIMLAVGTTGTSRSGFPIERAYYLMPKILPGAQAEDIGVIGGTFIEGVDGSIPHEEEFEEVLRRAKEFYGLT